MGIRVVKLECPGCGAAVDSDRKECEFCGSRLVVTSFSDICGMSSPGVSRYMGSLKAALREMPRDASLNTAAALCCLRLKQYDEAAAAFERVIGLGCTDPEVYFWAAATQLKGKKAFLTPRTGVEKAMAFLNAAIALEPRGVFWLFLAYLQYDYFERKYLNASPGSWICLEQARRYGVPSADRKLLFEVLGVSDPFAR